MPDRLPRLETSAGAQRGFCAAFDGETTCSLRAGHHDAVPHRFRDPGGSGRWIAKDDFGVEVGRGGGGPSWQADAPSTTDGLLDEDASGGPLFGRPGRPSCACGDVEMPPTVGLAVTGPDGRAHGRLLCHRRRSDRPDAPSCGHTIPGIAGARLGPCQHPVGHAGMHRDWTGAEWSPRATPGFVEGLRAAARLLRAPELADRSAADLAAMLDGHAEQLERA